MEFSCKMLKCDTGDLSMFPRKEVERAIVEYMKQKILVGELYESHVSGFGSVINLAKVSHKILDTFVSKEGEWIAIADTLDTRNGKIIEEILTLGIQPQLSPRYSNTVDKKGKVTNITLIAIDALREEDKNTLSKELGFAMGKYEDISA